MIVHGIIGLADLLGQAISQASRQSAAADETSEQVLYCRSIRESATLLQSLISDILDFSKVLDDMSSGTKCYFAI